MALNLADHGIPLALFNRVEPDGSRPLLHFLEEIGGTLITDDEPESVANRTKSRTSSHEAQPAEANEAPDGVTDRNDSRRVRGCEELGTLVRHLKRPRTLLLMVPAGDAVDDVLRELQPHLAAGDLVIDGGNSHYESSERRGEALRRGGVHFVGMGVSGGAEGARRGPALMPGGSIEAWTRFAPIAEAVAASAEDGSPCCRWMGPGGAGHFVKMVHNGIEYAEMELFAEIAWLLERVGKLSFTQIADTFDQWSHTVQGGFLTELTARIYRKPDRDGKPLLGRVRDRAGQKGTGSWCVKAALELGVSTPIIAGAVQARVHSSHPARTTDPETEYEEDSIKTTGRSLNSSFVICQLEQALLGARLLAYAEGIQLIQAASSTHGWSVPLRDVLQNWKAGSILRSGLLTPLQGILPSDAPNTHPLKWSGLLERIQMAAPALRLSVQLALEHYLPTPALSAALTTLDTLNSPTLPTRLIQAQRDGFGHHTFERTDRPAGEWFHSDWTSESPDPDEEIGP
ncbi:MAG: NADP-dependent phosphogluconate dehydrogenase [Bacteroidota bacterium]